MLIQFALRAYKWAISPMLAPACRFTPTCSEYALEAVEQCGVVRGSAKAMWRLLRCHPLAKGGYDPVEKSDRCPVINTQLCASGHNPGVGESRGKARGFAPELANLQER